MRGLSFRIWWADGSVVHGMVDWRRGRLVDVCTAASVVTRIVLSPPGPFREDSKGFALVVSCDVVSSKIINMEQVLQDFRGLWARGLTISQGFGC